MTDAPAPFIQTYFMGPHVEYFANRFKTSCVCPCPNSESIWMEPGFQLCQWKDRPRDSYYERCVKLEFQSNINTKKKFLKKFTYGILPKGLIFRHFLNTLFLVSLPITLRASHKMNMTSCVGYYSKLTSIWKPFQGCILSRIDNIPLDSISDVF